jgi:hypothetical protein
MGRLEKYEKYLFYFDLGIPMTTQIRLLDIGKKTQKSTPPICDSHYKCHTLWKNLLIPHTTYTINAGSCM